MKTIYKILTLIILIIACNDGYSKGNNVTEKITNNPKEAYFYVKQLESYYPLLWTGEDKSIKGYNTDESAMEQNSIYDFKIDKIRNNGPQDKRLKIAEGRGFFQLLEKAFNAPLKTVVDIRGKHGSSEFNYKLAGTLLVSKYIYYLKILRLANEKQWEKVAHNLKVWTNAIAVIKPNGTHKKGVKRLIDHLLTNYKIPDKEKKIILKLQKQTSNSGT